MDTSIDPLLLQRYCAGECTAAERAALNDWIGTDPERREMVDRSAAIWADWSRRRPLVDVNQAWASVQHAAARAQVPLTEMPDHRLPQRQGRYVRASWQAVTAMAASLVLVIGLGLLWHGPDAWRSSGAAREYATAAGQRMTVTLVDGTQITMAPGSHIRVARNYGAHGVPREVALDGEAYFAVVHDVHRPFAVHAAQVTVRDVGTVFDVQAYADDRDVRVAVAQGRVAIGNAALAAGDIALIADGVIHTMHDANVAAITGWMQGRLVFDGMPLRQVVQELNRAFDVHITVADSTLAADPVSGVFDNQTIGQVLDAITTVVGARYERVGQTIVIRRPALRGVRDRSGAHVPLTTAQASRTNE